MPPSQKKKKKEQIPYFDHIEKDFMALTVWRLISERYKENQRKNKVMMNFKENEVLQERKCDRSIQSDSAVNMAVTNLKQT